MDKIQALQWHFEANGMLRGFGFSPNFGNTTNHDTDMILMDDSEENEAKDEAVVSGESKNVSKFDVQLAARARAYPQFSRVPLYSIVDLAECGYPSCLHALAAHIKQPEFPLLFSQFLYKCFVKGFTPLCPTWAMVLGDGLVVTSLWLSPEVSDNKVRGGDRTSVE